MEKSVDRMDRCLCREMYRKLSARGAGFGGVGCAMRTLYQ